jgi:hypothetical protein
VNSSCSSDPCGSDAVTGQSSVQCDNASRFTELASRLRELATGRIEWRVQDPVRKCYCMVFDRYDHINPEYEAREWLAEFQRKFPNHEHAKYEVAEVRSFTEMERTALEAADALERIQSHGRDGVTANALTSEDGEARLACNGRNGKETS